MPYAVIRPWVLGLVSPCCCDLVQRGMPRKCPHCPPAQRSESLFLRRQMEGLLDSIGESALTKLAELTVGDPKYCEVPSYPA